MENKIPLFKIYWEDDDVKAVSDVIRRGMGWAAGPEVAEFEKMVAGYIGTRYCISFNSGTSALHALIASSGIGEGDEVIVPSFTFISTANSVLHAGARPVFADIEEKTLGLDPEDVRRRITKKTKAIVPVHYAGCPCMIKELKRIAEENDLLLLEDNAESFGATVDGSMVGTFGDAAMLSFCQNKVVTTGEGGAVVTGSPELAEKLKLFRSHGRKEISDYFTNPFGGDYVSLGYNFRLPSMCAALGISQMNKVDSIISMRRERAESLAEALSALGIRNAQSPPDGYSHVYQLFTIRAKDRDRVISALAKAGIGSKVFFAPAHKTPFYRSLGYEVSLPVTERVSDEVLTLPMHPSLSDEDIGCIIKALEPFF